MPLPEPTASVEYAAPEACPSEEAFWRAFSARARRTQRGPEGEWKLRVTIRGEPGHFDGTVEIGHAGETITRQVGDSSCADLATALAVIAAISVEPENPEPLTPTPRPAPPPPEPPPAPLPPKKRFWHLRAGADFATTTYLAPSFSLDGVFFVELGREATSVLTPWIRVGLHYANSGPIHFDPYTAVVESWLGRLELGVLRFRLPRGFDFRMAVVSEIGALVGESQLTQSAPFADIGALARLRWESPFLFLEAALGGLAIPWQPHFVFQPGPVTLFDVPWGGLLGEIGLGLKFLLIVGALAGNMATWNSPWWPSP